MLRRASGLPGSVWSQSRTLLRERQPEIGSKSVFFGFPASESHVISLFCKLISLLRPLRLQVGCQELYLLFFYRPQIDLHQYNGLGQPSY